MFFFERFIQIWQSEYPVQNTILNQVWRKQRHELSIKNNAYEMAVNIIHVLILLPTLKQSATEARNKNNSWTRLQWQDVIF